MSVLFAALQKRPEDINRRSADMWSFAVLLWELVTREVPFADLSHMEIGMKVSGRKHSSTHRLIMYSQLHLRISRFTAPNVIPSKHPEGFFLDLDVYSNFVSRLPLIAQVALEGLRPTIPPGISPHICKLMRLCMNEDPAKRPKFDMIVPILEKMQDK